ncbi:MAG: tetratricopeptide repeat protein [Bacteroidales bacterium]|nr:tetratricopeptide repeat protein [Bacteroidales bacterium]
MNKIISILLFSSLFLYSCEGQVNKGSNTDNTPTDSLEMLHEKIDHDPNNAVFLSQRAEMHMNANQFNLAIADIQAAINIDPDNTSYYLSLADYFLASGQLKNSMGVLKKVLSINPNNIEALLKMGEINLMVRKYQDVFTFANAVLDHDPYNSKAYFMRAYTYKELRDTTRAIDNFMQCLKNDHQNYNANIELGIIYSAKRDAIAIQYFNNAIAIDSLSEMAYYNLGMFYQNNDYLNEAFETYRTLMKVKPNFPYSYYNTGYIYMQLLKVHDEAIIYFSKAIEVQPDYIEAYYNRGLCYEILGDVQKARIDYMHALQLKNNYDKALEGINRIDDMTR